MTCICIYVNIYISTQACGNFVNDLSLIEKWQSLRWRLSCSQPMIIWVMLVCSFECLLVKCPPYVRLQSQCQPDGLPCPARFAFPLGFACGFLSR